MTESLNSLIQIQVLLVRVEFVALALGTILLLFGNWRGYIILGVVCGWFALTSFVQGDFAYAIINAIISYALFHQGGLKRSHTTTNSTPSDSQISRI